MGPGHTQAPLPAAETAVDPARLPVRLAAEGRWHLQRDDLLAAQDTFRRLRALAPDDLAGLLGLGQVHLKLGRVHLAEIYAQAARARFPGDIKAAALHVRALLRQRRFELAVEVSTEALATLPEVGPEILAAHASALFRVQRTAEASRAYRRVLEFDDAHAEAHIRLGSGLIDPGPAPITAALRAGVRAQRAGELDGAIAKFHEVLRGDPDHSIAHRLLGEALLERQAAESVASSAPEFQLLRRAVATPEVDHRSVEKFMPVFASLDAERREVATAALAIFGSYLRRLVTMGGRHDLLAELERTTEAPARAGLRGKRTFDGRVWDDVRGMGGLRAATGIEALDDALHFGFNTLAHEIAHQAHLYGFRSADRRRIGELYAAAEQGGWCLDYYAANNEAEYFGQGVEAFVSLGKRPGREVTHGHTRFELYRVDPALYDFIVSVADFDPLADPSARAALLPAAVEVALISGRPEDALVAAGMMAEGEEKERLLVRARRAVLLARSL